MEKWRFTEYLGCLLPIAAVVIVLIIIWPSGKTGKPYFVEETKYFHSPQNKDNCKFYKSAKENRLSIKRVSESETIVYGYKMCKVCYGQKEQAEHIKKIAGFRQLELKSKDYRFWEDLEYESKQKFDSLYVYIDSKNTLHIDGNCISVINQTTSRIPFANIESIENTCEECVERWLCDFIYKKVYEGVYDPKVIKSPDGEEYDYYDNYPEPDDR